MTPAQAKRNAEFMAFIARTRIDGYFISTVGVPIGEQITIDYETDGPRTASVVVCHQLSDGTIKVSFRWLTS